MAVMLVALAPVLAATVLYPLEVAASPALFLFQDFQHYAVFLARKFSFQERYNLD